MDEEQFRINEGDFVKVHDTWIRSSRETDVIDLGGLRKKKRDGKLTPKEELILSMAEEAVNDDNKGVMD
jgi:hypothetical protein